MIYNNFVLWIISSLIIVEAIWWLTPKNWWDIKNFGDAVATKITIIFITLMINGLYIGAASAYKGTNDEFVTLTLSQYIIPILWLSGSIIFAALFVYINVLRYRKTKKVKK